MPDKALVPWEVLEHEVEMIFRAAGYDTQRNIEVGGFEFDLLATRDEFAGLRVNIAVECKHREKAAVSNTDIHEFLNAYNASRERLNLAHGIVVTNTRFSRQAHEAINQHSAFRLLTFSNLEDELLGAHAYLNSAAKHYRSHLKSRFIDLSADSQTPEGTSEVVPQIVQHLASRIATEDQLFAVVLGDFGSGKTTVAEQLHQACAEAYLTKKGDVYPFIFYLRTLAQFDTEQSYIGAQMTQYSRAVSAELFPRIQNSRRTLLILDGFDEVATHSTAEERLALFSRVMRISQRASHLILTSRPSTFTNLYEINALIKNLIARDFTLAQKSKKLVRRADEDRDKALARTTRLVRQHRVGDEYRLFPAEASSVLYLRPFTRSNIIDYLEPFAELIQQKHGMTIPQVYDLLSKVYDVTDLITRPLLLEMFVEILTQGDIDLGDPDLEIGPAGLYQTYVNLHLDRDWKVRQFLTRDERLTFARAAAIVMLESGGSLEASYTSIERVVEGGMTDIASGRWSELKGQMSQVINDVRVCSFMNVTPNDRIEFAHKSFMEFFIADVIISKLAHRKPIEELNAALTYEVIYFLGSFCLLRSDYRIEMLNHLKDVAYGQGDDYRSKIKLGLLYSERESYGREYERISFDALKIRKRDLYDSRFTDVSLTKVHLEDILFSGCTFNEVRLDGEFDRVHFVGGRGALQLAGTIRNCNVEDVRDTANVEDFGRAEDIEQGIGFEFVALRDELRFQKGTWSNSALSLRAESVCFESTQLQDVILTLNDVSRLSFSNARMLGGEIRSIVEPPQRASSTIEIQLNGNVFENVRLSGLVIDRDMYLALEAGLTGCHGYVVVQDKTKTLRSFMQRLPGERSLRYVGWTVIERVLFVAPHHLQNLAAVPPSTFASDRSIRVWAEATLK